MKMKRFIAMLLALIMTASCACAADDYTVAEKLVKQLWAGSGFSGTLQLELNTSQLRTRKPIEVAVDYIYVRPTEVEPDEHRVDIRLEGDDAPTSAASFQMKNKTLAFQADVLSPDWYALTLAKDSDSAAQAAVAQRVQGMMSMFGVPSISNTALSLLGVLGDSNALNEVLEPYKTSVDVWIEAYRQDAILGKRDDGSTTMEVNYLVPPAAIKAQIKQMVLDMLGDEALINALTDALGEETAWKYVNPNLRSWYFSAVDALPLTGNMTISRMVSFKGETLKLQLTLPLYDAQNGAATLEYARQSGEGELPDENVIRLTSDERTVALTYQEYSSMTGVRVMKGRMENRPVRNANTGFATDFTLKQTETYDRDADERVVYGYNLELTLQPENADDIELSLASLFLSKELKSAATEMEATLCIKRGDETVKAAMKGASRKKWEPEAVPGERVSVEDLTHTDLLATLTGAGVRLKAVLDGYLEWGKAEAPAKDADTAPVAEPSEDAETAPVEEPNDDAEDAPVEEPNEDADTATDKEPNEDAEDTPDEEMNEDADTAPVAEPSEDAETAPVEEPNEDADTAPVEEPTDGAEDAPVEKPQEA